MISYMCVIQTKSVSVIVFEIIAIKTLFDLSRSKVKFWKHVWFHSNLDISNAASNNDDLNIRKRKLKFWPFKVTQGQGQGHYKNWFINFCMYAWLPYQYLQQFARYSHPKILQTRVWPFRVIQGQILLHQMKAHTWLPIPLLLKPSPYLLPFSSYFAK